MYIAFAVLAILVLAIVSVMIACARSKDVEKDIINMMTAESNPVEN